MRVQIFQRRWILPLIVAVGALLPRLILAARSQHVGLWDPTHYYLLGRNLAAGRGFVIDYIWHYANQPAGVTHPIDHWMPLPGVLVALGIKLGGDTTFAALLPFVVMGVVQVLLAVWLARRVGLSLAGQALSGVAVSFLPWLFLSSLHTDTTTVFAVWACLALTGMWLGFTSDGRWLWLSGVCGGLALLTRNDAILLLPVFVLSGVIYRWAGAARVRWYHVAGFFGLFAVVIAPWAVRNQMVLGEPWPGSVMRSAFVREHEEFYSYALPITLDRYLAWGIPNIASKWVFELAASVKLMISLCGVLFSTALGGLLLGGAVGLGQRLRARRTLPDLPAAEQFDLTATALRLVYALLPALLFVGLAWLFYGIVTPFLSQAGSFKKAFLGALPMLLVGGVGLIMALVRDRASQCALVGLVLVALVPPVFDTVRDDFTLNDSYAAQHVPVKQALDALQAEQADEVVVMTRDPWTAQYLLDYRAIMVPQDNFETILAVADRYGANYLWLPVPREPLEPIYAGTGTHPRLRLAAEIPGSEYEIWAILPSDAEE